MVRNPLTRLKSRSLRSGRQRFTAPGARYWKRQAFAGSTSSEAKSGGNPTYISLFETLAYPANPKVPGFIIMTNMNSSESRGNILVFYTDLIIQDGAPHEEEKRLFSSAAKGICKRHGHNMEEYQAMVTGQGILGGSAGECGFLNFFEEKDIPLLEELIREVLPAYRDIIDKTKDEVPDEEDFQ